MTWRLIAALIGPVIAGLLVTYLLTSDDESGSPQPGALGTRLSLSVGAGFGFSALFFFLFLLLYGQANAWLILFEVAVLLALFLGGKSRLSGGFRVRSRRAGGPRLVRLYAFVHLSFYVLLVAALINFTLHTINHPHGGWDAWESWNMRARFLFKAGTNWDRAFSDLLSWSQADYPLLLPANVARLWTYLGEEALVGNAFIAFVFTFATLALLVSALHGLRGRTPAYTGGLILLATAYFIRHGAAQYADVPLGFYMLATVVLLTLQDEAPGQKTGLAYLTGFFAGFAAWTKNEGLLFLFCLVLARSLVMIARKSHRAALLKEVRPFLLALVPLLLLLLYFKTQLAPPNNLIAGQGFQQTIERLTDLSRPTQIGQSFLDILLHHDALVVVLIPLYAGLLGLQASPLKRNGVVTSLLIIGLMLGGYFLIFLTTPYDLNWQLDHALNRLLLQLWPTVIFLTMLMVTPPARRTDQQPAQHGEEPVPA